MSTVINNGVKLHVEHSGPAPGTPLLLTHGFSATGAMFDATVDALRTACPCITWDVRGHGRSDYPTGTDDYSIQLALSDMLAVLDAQHIERAALLGHSMGGYLSLEFQRVHPERVAALVLVGTGPGYRNDQARAGWNQICEDFALALEQRGFGGLPGDRDEMRADEHRSVDGLIKAARGILRQHDAAVLNHLPEITVPTLVIVGDQDVQFVAGSGYMATKIPLSQLVTIDGSGHTPMLSHKDAFIRALTTFLNDIDERSQAPSQ